MVELNIKLPENFLKEEMRNDYLVTSQMKEVWAVELDILVKILEVCKKHDIKVFACGGTMLGAVRHKGFIPWDDDVDLEMDRDNYEKLCKIGPSEFKYPYFFQTYKTDKDFVRGHIQVRRSDTTAILKSEVQKKEPFNQGIFVDVFPCDKFPDDPKEDEKFRGKIYKLKDEAKLSSRRFKEYNLSQSKRPINYIKYPIMKLAYKNSYKKMEKEVVKYNHKKCKNCGLITMNPLEHRFQRGANSFGEVIMMNFEFIKIPVSVCYDDILTRWYGDYMKPVKAPSEHGDVIFDTNNSYIDYFLTHKV